MPQMAPISWLSLFIVFLLIFFMFNIMNYFSIMPNVPKLINKMSKNPTHLNWKW